MGNLIQWVIKTRKRNQMKRAIRKANKMWLQSGNKFLCLWYKGRCIVKAKSSLKEMIKDKQFKKGVTIQDLENLAFYKTLG